MKTHLMIKQRFPLLRSYLNMEAPNSRYVVYHMVTDHDTESCTIPLHMCWLKFSLHVAKWIHISCSIGGSNTRNDTLS